MVHFDLKLLAISLWIMLLVLMKDRFMCPGALTQL